MMKMNSANSELEIENQNAAINVTHAKAAYVKPAIEVIEMEMEGAILSGSGSGNDFDDGGHYGRNRNY